LLSRGEHKRDAMSLRAGFFQNREELLRFREQMAAKLVTHIDPVHGMSGDRMSAQMIRRPVCCRELLTVQPQVGFPPFRAVQADGKREAVRKLLSRRSLACLS